MSPLDDPDPGAGMEGHHSSPHAPNPADHEGAPPCPDSGNAAIGDAPNGAATNPPDGSPNHAPDVGAGNVPPSCPGSGGGWHWVTLDTCNTPMEGHIARVKLEEAGIDAVLENENVFNAIPIYGQAVGGIRLMVPSDRVGEALEVLGHAVTGGCPACGSRRIIHRPMSMRRLIVSILLLTIPLVFYRRRWICLDCNHEWT